MMQKKISTAQQFDFFDTRKGIFMEIKVAKYISQFLVDHGIKDCFMVTGGGAMHLDDAIGHQEGIHCTFNHYI